MSRDFPRLDIDGLAMTFVSLAYRAGFEGEDAIKAASKAAVKIAEEVDGIHAETLDRKETSRRIRIRALRDHPGSASAKRAQAPRSG